MSELHDMSMTGSYLAKIEQLKRELAEAKRDAGYDQRNAAQSQAESAKLLRELAEKDKQIASARELFVAMEDCYPVYDGVDDWLKSKEPK